MKSAGIKFIDGTTLISVYDLNPVGTIIHSILTESQFTGETGAGWVLADGRNVSGSRYNTITGNVTVPDLRGQFLRGKNNGRSDGNQNPDGDLTLGSYQVNEVKGHNHIGGMTTDVNFAMSYGGTSAAPNTTWRYGVQNASGSLNAFTSNTGGNETRPNNITINYFIKIN